MSSPIVHPFDHARSEVYKWRTDPTPGGFVFSLPGSLISLSAYSGTMSPTDLAAQKQALRERAFENRKAQESKDELSRQILAKFVDLPEYERAKTVLFYVDARSEVRTRFDLPDALSSGKQIIVPWCNDAGELELFKLAEMSELELGMYKILEPRQDLRTLPEKQVPVAELDLVMVPGVAFDDRGGRMGHGKGYYDKLLENARPDCPLVALAFECQIFPEVPMGDHDIFMDKVITERRVIEGRGRAS